MISIDDIFYGSSMLTGHGINYGQDIMIVGNKHPIGWLETRYTGKGKPATEKYQFCINKRPPENFVYIESEDVGYYYVQFPTLEEFVLGYNILNKKVQS